MAHVVTPEAEADLDAIWYYIATESGQIERADRLIEALTTRFYMLSTHPRIGRARDDLRPGLRSFTAGGYVIIYRLAEQDDVLILHVRHGRQDVHDIRMS